MIALLILGGLAWGWMAATGRNPVAAIAGKRAWLVYAAVGFAAVFVLFVGRNAFLPFLGPTVFPCSLLENRVPQGADTDVAITTRPYAKVMYWAAEPDTEHMKTLKNWKGAYLGYANAGVTEADEFGKAMLRIRKPQPYTVPMRGRLESHVHYRICTSEGSLSQIETVFLGSNDSFEDVAAPTQMPPQMPDIAPQMPDIAPQVPDISEMPQMAALTVQPQDPTTKMETAPEGTSEEDKFSAIEGFMNDPVYATANPVESKQASLFAVSPGPDRHLLELQTLVERAAQPMFETNGYEEGDAYTGSMLDTAFAEPAKPVATARGAFGAPSTA